MECLAGHMLQGLVNSSLRKLRRALTNLLPFLPKL